MLVVEAEKADEHIPAAVKGNPAIIAAVVEHDVQRGHVCLECQSWWCLLRTIGIINGIVLNSNSELAPGREIAVHG